MHCRLILQVAMTAIVSLIATSAPAQIVVPTLVSTQNDNTDVAVGASLDNLTNGSGLSSPLPNGSTLETALTVTHTFSGSGELQSWTTRSSLPSADYYSASPMPVFVWDLGQDTPLDHIVLWQYGNDGGGLNRDGNAARTFLLRFNTAAEGPSFAGASEFGGTLTRPWAIGGTNGAQAFPLGGVIARYVELTVSDNYFGAGGTVGGGDRVGLGEIRFNVGTVSNAAPVARSVVVSAQEGMARAGALLATDADGDALVFSIVTPVAKGTLTITDTATGAFTYIPNAGAVGYDTFTFRATDGSGASSEAMGAVFIVASSPRWPGQTVRVSVASDGAEGNGSSIFGGISSADGRFIAFNSAASNLVAGDTNGEMDVFVHDRQTGLTTRVSVASNATQGNGLSLASDMTPDGRYVAFTSSASNLVADDTNGQIDAFVHDRQTGQTTRISVVSDGTQGNDESVYPVLSADGRYVAFYGRATNLVANDTNGGDEDVFVHDRQTGQTTLVSVSSDGVQGNSNNWRPSMSADGRFIAFQSESSNLVAGDTNGAIDLFVHDLWAGQTTRVSVTSDGAQANGDSGGFLSADGRHVALTSVASNLVPGDTNGVEDAFVHDRQTGLTTRVSVATSGAQVNDVTTFANVSADGRYVVIQSMASNLVENDTNGAADVFVHDRQTGRTVRVSVSSDGSQGNAASAGSDDFGSGPAISADGRSILLPSSASNLVPDDSNNTDDMFVVGLVSVSPTTVNVPSAGGVGSIGVSFDYPGTPWNATAEDSWITITNQSSTDGNGSVDYSVAPNSTGVARTGALTVATQTVTVYQERSTAPAATDGTIATVEDMSASGTLSATDPNGAPLTYSIVTDGTLGTVTVTNPPTGAFTYTPNPDANGTDTFTFKANNGSADSNIATVTVTITAVNDAPVAVNGMLTTAEDTPASGTLSATDIDGPALTFSIVTNGAKGVATITNAATGAFTYTPNANANGSDTVTFSASDGTLTSNVASVAVSIAAINDAPVSSNVTLTVNEDTAGSGTLFAIDIDSPALTYSIVANGAKGTAVVTNVATGAFTYTPNPNATGGDTFTYKANDGALDSGVATVTVTITAVDDPPVAQTSVGMTTPGAPFSGMLLGSDSDGDPVVFALLSQPSQGSVVLTDATTGGFTYTPNPGASGYDSFTYQVGPAGGAGAVAAASLDTSPTGTFMLFIVTNSPQWPGQTTRVSVASDGTQANGSASSFLPPSVSADGRLVAFVSNASNLVAGDSNGTSDVFVHDRQTGATTRVSVASDGTQANGRSFSAPSLSADGRFVAFSSFASNLAAGDTNNQADAFVHDRQTGTTTRVSVASDGTQSNGVSARVEVSADGRFVAFDSFASNLIVGDTNATWDVFLHDRQTGATTRVSVASDGTQANGFSDTSSVSADGRFVAFRSAASNLVAGDTNATQDVFVHDRQTGGTTRVSVASDGTQATANNGSVQPSVSADGRFVAFASAASNLVAGDTNNGQYDVFVHDRQTGTTTRVSVASDGTPANNATSHWPSISADGRFVAFSSFASNLAAGDTNNQTDAFVHDRQTGTTTRVSVASDGTQANGFSDLVEVSADGRFVAFPSLASNLVPGDTNAREDVFVVGAVTTPIPDISPGALAFGNQLVSITSASQTITLSNTGNGDLLITNIEMTGTNAGDFGRTTTCGAALAPGATCTIAVTFTPAATGSRTATLEVSTNAPTPTTVGLTGTGTAPVATVSTNSLTFGNQNVGTTSAAQAITLSNSGTGPLLISSLSVTGVNGADFGQTNTCGASVAPGASCTISVTFAPTNTGTRTAAVSIADNAPGSPQTIGLTGTGRPGQITLTPSTLTFGPQLVETTSAGQAVAVKNAGTTTMTLSGNTASGDFSVSSTTCGSSLAPGATCTVNIVFTPTSAGSRAGTLTVTSNVGPGTVALTGTGTIISLSPSAIDFGYQTVGTSSARPITLRNISSTTAVDISAMGLGGNASADYATTTTCGSTIAPGATCTIDVRFTPTKKGARNASLTVTHTSFGSPLTVSLRGAGK